MSKAPTRSAPPPPPPEDDTGASANERLLAAAKTDNEVLFDSAIKVLEDVNYVDGIQNASTTILEPLLEHETCDVDLRNRLQGDTPLHIAVRQKWDEHKGLRVYLVESLLEAGANTLIRNRHNEKPIDLLPPSLPNSDPESEDEVIRAAIRRAEAEAALGDAGDVVDDPNDIASDSD